MSKSTGTRKYKTGDIVQLKSGGPKMTVKEYSRHFSSVNPMEERFHVSCQWFAGSKHEQAEFPEQSLDPAQADKKP